MCAPNELKPLGRFPPHFQFSRLSQFQLGFRAVPLNFELQQSLGFVESHQLTAEKKRRSRTVPGHSYLSFQQVHQEIHRTWQMLSTLIRAVKLALNGYQLSILSLFLRKTIAALRSLAQLVRSCCQPSLSILQGFLTIGFLQGPRQTHQPRSMNCAKVAPFSVLYFITSDWDHLGGLGIVRMNFSHGTHEVRGYIVLNVWDLERFILPLSHFPKKTRVRQRADVRNKNSITNL